jgi:cation:H+ antiporter
MWQPLLMLVVSLLLLTFGAEVLVRGSSVLALRAGVSAFFVGMTVVGFGTSTPELATSLFAALEGAPEIAIGNVVGSNIANLLLVLGAVAVIRAIAVKATSIVREVGLLIVVTALPYLALATGGELGRILGILFVAGLVAFIAWSYRVSRSESAVVQAEAPTIPPGWKGGWTLNIVLTVVGVAILAFSSRLLVDASVTLAEMWGVSKLVIGLTIVAIGTSAPVPIDQQVFIFDLPVAIAAAVVLIPLVFTGGRISRLEGALLLVCFVLYTAALYTGLPAEWIAASDAASP